VSRGLDRCQITRAVQGRPRLARPLPLDGMITVPGWPYIVIPAAVGAAAGGSELE
jgi:hypothetical protein